MEALHDDVDFAVEQSFRESTQRGIGLLARWSVAACWTGEGDDSAYLIARGRPGERSDSARLRVFEKPNASISGWLLTTFDMDFNTEGINTHQTIVDTVGVREVLMVEKAQRQERRAGLSGMTEEQAHMLFTQLDRGMSGRYVRARRLTFSPKYR